MTRLTLSNDQVMLYDDFLPKESFEPLLGHVYSSPCRLVHRGAWIKNWHSNDGLPLIGQPTFFREDGAYGPDEKSRYPTRTPLDKLMEEVRRTAGEASALIGEHGVRWNGMNVWPYLLPRGTALSMHRDAYYYSGAFIFYVHHQWDVHWGGHLVILDDRTGMGIDKDAPEMFSFLSEEAENRVLSEPGVGLSIVPRPNRLVLLRENVYHMITRVDADAGDRARITLTGFFLTGNA
ncbi:MAG TPA: 2OG-Fe(II) oxygenase [Thermoanaerobaculia bacterium]